MGPPPYKEIILPTKQNHPNKNYKIMKTEDLKYESPQIEFMEVEVEKGFATSSESEGYTPNAW